MGRPRDCLLLYHTWGPTALKLPTPPRVGEYPVRPKADGLCCSVVILTFISAYATLLPMAAPDRFWHAFDLCGPVPAEKRFLIHCDSSSD